MNASTGRGIDDEIEHIRQSIVRILTTPVGSRLKRREFGSLLPDLIDQPSTQANTLRLIAATYMAIIRWEPRISPVSASLEISADGRVTIDMNGTMRSGPRAGSSFNMNIPIR